MKCLIKNVLIFSKLLKLNFKESFSNSHIKASVHKLSSNKILNQYRFSLKSPFSYSLNQNSFPSIKNLNNNKLFYTIIRIHPHLYEYYFRCHNINPPQFDFSILKKKINFLQQNVNSILSNHLNTNFDTFHSDFRLQLKTYNSNIAKIDKYIKINSLKSKQNNLLTSAVINTPKSISKSKPSFYPRYVIFLKLNRRLTQMFFFLRS